MFKYNRNLLKQKLFMLWKLKHDVNFVIVCFILIVWTLFLLLLFRHAFFLKEHFIMYLWNNKNYLCKKIIRRKKQAVKHKLIVLNAFSERVKILWVLFTKKLSNLYKTTTLGTIQKWSSWTCGCLIKHLYKTTTN